MSSDQQSYSFGNPSGQAPTPTQTPTSGQFPSPPAFQTPGNSSGFESRGGWTPIFAEEYSVFNATPGRLTSAQQHFAEGSTPRPSTSSAHRRLSAEGFATEIATHVHHHSQTPKFSLPPVDPLNQLPSSPGPCPATQSRFDDHATNSQVTPRKPRKRLEEAFSAQTVTPPATKSKGSRKLAPKLPTHTMQHESQDSHYGASQTPTHQQSLMCFASSSSEFFYPMSAPVTAPVFTNTKFWDEDASMGGMDLDFSTHDPSMYNMGSHRTNNSFDWGGRTNQMFQETLNVSNPTPNVASKNEHSTVKRQRPLAPKLPRATAELLPSTMAPFEFNTASASEDPFSSSILGAVDPGLLYSRNKPAPMPSEFQDVVLPPTRPVTSHAELKPYQHQLRESMRDQEELRRSRGSRESSRTRRFERGIASSPVKGSARPGLQRSISDSRGRRSQDRVLSRSSTGRISPIKLQRPSNLMSIPEMARPRIRTEVKFTIDPNGRARTETVLVEEGPRGGRGGPSSRSEGWVSSHYEESSSDDEPILVPSRNTSSLPQQKPPKIGTVDTSRAQRYSSGARSRSESSGQRLFRRDSLGSEAETVREADDGSGDAAQALRKVMESRKKAQEKPRNPQHHRYSDTTPRGNFHHGNYSSSHNMSPSTAPDPDGGTTPLSSNSGTTRCVCGNSESEGLMILCESCDNWLHADCVGIDHRSLPPVYVCALCVQTPTWRGRRIREPAKGVQRMGLSPLAHKSLRSFR